MKRFLISVFLSGLLVGCGKDEDFVGGDPMDRGNDWDIVIASSKHGPGIGNTAGTPNGTAWQLPGGVEVVSRTDKPFNPDLGMLYGNLNTFYVDIHMVNHGSAAVTVEIPAGLIFLFRHEGRTQNGLLAATVRVTVPPTPAAGIAQAEATTVYLGLGCLNYSMAFPWEDNQQSDTKDYPIGKDMYAPSVVTSDPNIRKLLDVLKDYPKLRLTRHYNPQEMFDENYRTPQWRVIYTLIQAALWEITDGPGLTRKDYRELVDALKPYK